MPLDGHTESSIFSHQRSFNTDLTNQILQCNDQMFDFAPISFFSGISNGNVFSSSIQQVELLCSPTPKIAGYPYLEDNSTPNEYSGVFRSSINALDQYNVNPLSTTNSTTSSDSSINHKSVTSSYQQTPEFDTSYDKMEIKSKFEELQRVLFDDTDVGFIDKSSARNNGGCVRTANCIAVQSTGRNSSLFSNGSTDEIFRESKTSKQLLFDCAAAISEGNFEEASAIISELRQIVSIQGDPDQRLASYLVEGLAARMSYSGQGIYKALRCKEPPTSDRLSAMQILFEACPYFKFGFMAANGAILEILRDNKKVHIIDFDISQGTQYISLLQSLSHCNRKPFLRITGVDDPESIQRATGGLKIIGLRLEKLAEDLVIPFQFCAISAKTEDVKPLMLGCHPDEALVVNFAYQLHHMPDESVSTINQRDRLLRMVKGLGPTLVTVIEQNMNTNTAPFFPRFVEVYNYYHTVFDSLEATLHRDDPDRMNVERQCLAKDMVNIVACEGADRIERYEVAGKWRARMTMAGFTSSSVSSHVIQEIRSQIKLYCDRYKLKEEAGALYFGWDDKLLVVASAWR